MSKPKSHGWKNEASWTCIACGTPVVEGPKTDAPMVCNLCVDGQQHCKEWDHAIAAKNGT